MKYLKTYEGKIKDIIQLALINNYHKRITSDKYTKYKKNTYVLTTDGKIGKIGHVEILDKVSYWMENDLPDDIRYEIGHYLEDDIIREATPEEVELFSHADKYNI